MTIVYNVGMVKEAKQQESDMTNQQITELARDKGYSAEVKSGRVDISLKNRKPSQMEISRELDIPSGLIHSHPQGVVIYGSDS